MYFWIEQPWRKLPLKIVITSALVLTAPARSHADAAVNAIVGSTAALVAAGMLGDCLRGKNPFAWQDNQRFYMTAGIGAQNVYLDSGDDWGNTTNGMVRAEARFPYRLWRFAPIMGLELSHRGSVYGYGGLMLDVYFGNHVVVSPNAALGYYSAGDGRDLGYPLEFRTGLEVAYHFDDGTRLGLAAHHISNAELGDFNPGIENLTLNYSVPFD